MWWHPIRINRVVSTALIASAFGLVLGLSETSVGDTFTVDSTNGTINGLSSGTINGTPWEYAGTIDEDQVVVFLFYGDLILNAGDVVQGLGSEVGITRGIEFRIGGNVDIATGVVFDMSASGLAGGPGGGTAGQGFTLTGFGGGFVGAVGLGGPASLGGAGGLPCFGGFDGFGGTLNLGNN